MSTTTTPPVISETTAPTEVKKTIENDGHNLLHRLVAAFDGDVHVALTWLELEAHRIAAKL